ncbi:MAG: PSD1 and planctomycete cytochrome C domain-containing protein [Pirellulaceae bacterium]|nr:PSD1 and planctomycete cytochrome C domain-containing protein [Pirellulaceae bacterium]
MNRLSCVLLFTQLPLIAQADPLSDQFEAEVRPVLVEHCFECHTTAAKGGLRLDSRRGLLDGGQSGAAIKPGKPAQSLLLRALTHQDPDLKMPPGGVLEDHEVDAIASWIKLGAVWPETSELPDDGLEMGKIQQQKWWSFQPQVHADIPLGKATEWGEPANAIDLFIGEKLAANQLVLARHADARTLLRRATYDLIGLPPSPEEMVDFERDCQRDFETAYASLVDRLLASPHYGERWGRHWLDLVRYADTAGDAADFPVPEAYKYRNYVIDAFNNDTPYDQFVREQIAGDLLPFRDEDQKWKQTIGTGFLAISRRIGVSPLGLRHVMIEDTIDNLGKTFLGLTLACARCHDHKFDPVPTADYYALYGIFDSSTYPHAGEEHKPWRRDFVYRLGQEQADKVLKPFRAELAEWNRKERAKLEEYRDFQRQKIDDPTKTREKAWQAVLALREQRRPYAEAFPDLEIAYAIQEGKPHDAFVQKRGNPNPQAKGRRVRRGFLQILGGDQLPDTATGSGRLELARWITHPRNPLTARVMVNRIWHHHFGKGIVRSTSDFGLRGYQPTHPELLDFLASYFVRHDWSVKQMHRLVMLSRAYRSASTGAAENRVRDPENVFLWRANRRRLDAEQLRDSILQFSNMLDRSPGGRHPFSHRLTYFYRQHEPFVGDFKTNRRSVYLLQQRIKKNEYLDLFDGPDGNVARGERPVTTTTLQALYLMNSSFVHQHAEVISARLREATDDREEQVRNAYRLIFVRTPLKVELERVEGFLGNGKEDKWPGFIRTMISSNEFIYVD